MPDNSILVESIVIMWVIRCHRNNVFFCGTQDPLSQRLGDVYHVIMGGDARIRSVNGVYGNRMGSEVKQVVLRGSLMWGSVARKMMVDGAWKKDSWEEAMAWCSVGDSGGGRNESFCEFSSDGGSSCGAACVGLGL